MTAFGDLHDELLRGAHENAWIARTAHRPDGAPLDKATPAAETFESMTQKNAAQACLALVQALVTLRKAANGK